MNTRGIFITGTDTGVGKTLVTAAVLRQLRQGGIDAVPMKPVQTGAERTRHGWRAPDLEFALSAIEYAPTPLERAHMAPFLYEHACSPHLAAELGAGLTSAVHDSSPEARADGGAGACPAPPLSMIDSIRLSSLALLDEHELVVAEGAGGVLVPLTRDLSTLDLMGALGWPVILVARLGLGTINHSLLSIRALRSAGLTVAGIVFNEVEPVSDASIAKDNPRTVCEIGEVPFLGILPHFDSLRSDDVRIWATIAARLQPLAIEPG